MTDTVQPLLVTKRYLPPLKPGYVPREGLLRRLDAGLNGKLIAILASPSFGKTTLLAEWSARRFGAVAWLSLDAADNHPARFFGYVMAAMQTCLLARCRDLGLTLISVTLVSPGILPAHPATEEHNMNSIRVEVSRAVDASPEAVLSLFRDYKVAHAAVLPKPYFVDMVIEKGGYGAGTVVRVRMKAYGVEKKYRFDVTEPEPGRILAETDPSTGLVTHFIADPLDGGKRCMVTLATTFPLPGGIAGWFERKMTPGLMRRIYQQELENVAYYLARPPAGPVTA